MKVERLLLKDFTVFAQAELPFSPGLNVLIGANGTGKSHVLKVLYSILRVVTSPGTGDDAETALWRRSAAVFRLHVDPPFYSNLTPGVPSHFAGHIHRSLIRHGANALHVDLHGDFGDFAFDIGVCDRMPLPPANADSASGHAVFVPTGEVLSVCPGFVAAHERRELSFDETYRDLCVDLSATALRSVVPPSLAGLAAKLDEVVGGKTVLRGDRFFVSLPGDWLLEASMLAEGFRKLAVIPHLIRNGSLAPGNVLLWDEPETNMNPKLIPTLARTLLALAGAGVQTFIATHDYLLTSEISLAAEYATEGAKLASPRFFAFAKPGPLDPVTVESGDTLADLQHNPILEEFAAHYDRERRLFYRSEPAGTREPD